MKAPAFFYRKFDLPRAIILSILIHLLVVFLLLPKMNKHDIKMPPPLQVSLAQPKSMENKPSPEKEKSPEPPKPEVKKPEPPKPEVKKPEPPNPEIKKEPLPVPEKTPTTVPLSKPPVSVKPKEEQITEANSKPEANPTRVITKAADTPAAVAVVLGLDILDDIDESDGFNAADCIDAVPTLATDSSEAVKSPPLWLG